VLEQIRRIETRSIAQGDGQYFELLKALRNAQLLVLDNWGLANLQPATYKALAPMPGGLHRRWRHPGQDYP